MMKATKRVSLALLLALCSLGMQAQRVDGGDKQVKRIMFDREQVTIVYQDGTTDEAVEETIVSRDATPTGIKGTRRQDTAAQRWYTIDGRSLQTAPQAVKKGVYVVKEGDKVRKIIQK